MTRRETGTFRIKHPPDRQVAPAITAAIQSRKRNNELSCAQAERIAARQEVGLAEVGVALDLLEVRLGKCQLGLFGHGPESKSVAPAASVAPALEAAIRESLTGGRLPCAAAWDIAARLKIGRKKVAAACETLKIKIKPCQLGAF